METENEITQFDPKTLKAKIEATLFVTARAMQVEEIATLLGAPFEDVEQALLDLMFDYSSRDESALEIDDEDGYIIQVRSEHLDIVEKLCPVDLTPAVLKTLTIIALKEPIRQADLKELRSTAYEHVAELVQKGLVSKTKDRNGRSFNLHTTPKFSEYFKLKGDVKTLAKMLDSNRQILEDLNKDIKEKPEENVSENDSELQEA